MDEVAALRAVVEGTATETGARFFEALVQNLCKALGTHGAWVTEYLPARRRLRALAFWAGTDWVRDYEYAIDGTPCAPVIDTASLVHIPDRVVALYPDDPDLCAHNAVSYMGVALKDVDGAVLGHLAVLDTRVLPEDPRLVALFRIFAARAAAELQRIRAERDVRDREEKLSRLIATAMDGIVELTADLRATLLNPAAEKLFGCVATDLIGRDFGRQLTDASRARLVDLVSATGAGTSGARSVWIPGGLEARTAGGRTVRMEATLSRGDTRGETFFTLIMRDVNERLEAEKKIRSLTDETDYLREEIQTRGGFAGILGRSAPMRELLHEIGRVAATDTTVLVSGETGTGKELVARAIHAASKRRDRPFVAVNCGAIPASLIESEFFGHERGAFTGATGRRLGRFALADRGTIMLDEIGELPLELQVKLLRVLQEGEFEPVGSSKTVKVDVRIVAATNRDLEEEVRQNRFRADLFYRLSVFPLRVPPLRERGEDVAILAAAFLDRFARKLHRSFAPLSDDGIARLQAYTWPGNVRELQNVIERAVITSRGDHVSFDSVLPLAKPPQAVAPDIPPPIAAERIQTIAEIEALERENVRRALQSARWRISGEGGAAMLLGINPSTLRSRMRALGIRRPPGD